MKLLSYLSLVTVIFLAACSYAVAPESQKLSVAASFYPLAYFSEQIGGDLVSVAQITPGGVEPHDYEPSPQELALAHDAKVFFMNGAGVDAWADKIIDELRQHGVVTVKMTDIISPMGGFQEQGEQDPIKPSDNMAATASDPHIWLDPVLAKREVEAIRSAMIQADPSHAITYRENADHLLAELSSLDDDFRSGLATCAVKQIVTSHNAFRYMAKEYGFESLAIAGLSPDEEPSPSRISELADFAKKHGIRYIFFETLISPKLAETVADEIGATSLVLNPIEGLTLDDAKEGKTYLSIMKENLQNLRTAMQCQ